MEKDKPCHTNQKKKAGVTILVSKNINSKIPKIITKDKKDHFRIIKESVQQECL